MRFSISSGALNGSLWHFWLDLWNLPCVILTSTQAIS